MNLQLDNNFESSYNRSFGRRNIVDHPFCHNFVNTEVKKDLQIPIFQEKVSTYEASSGYKSREGVNCHRRFSLNSKPNLRRLHEEYLGNPAKPHETGLTSSGKIHGKLNPLFPAPFECNRLAKNAIRPLKLRSIDKLIIPIHENNFQKLLDIYVTTSRLAHIDFFRNQGNIIPKNNNNHEIDTKNRKINFSFNSEEKTLYRQFPKQFSRLPHSGNISTYSKDYKQISSRHFEFNYEFPTLQKLTKSDIFTVPGMYLTEKSHFGTEWSIGAVVGP